MNLLLSRIKHQPLQGFQKHPHFPVNTLTLFGTNLGRKEQDNAVIFNDSLVISSSKTLEWLNGRIILEVPVGAVTGSVFVVTSDDTTNSLNIDIAKLPTYETVTINAGTFEMGSSQGAGDEQPVHTVNITEPFEMFKYEVTELLYNVVMQNNPSEYISKYFPVHNLKWIDAVEFCNKLSEIEGLTPAYQISSDDLVSWNVASNGWRLPTEAEWEYACRAGTNDDFGIKTDTLSNIGWYNSNSGFLPHIIGMKRANNWNLYDMHGNVWEWCWDYYDEDYYSISESTVPKGPQLGERHVARGGAYNSGITFLKMLQQKVKL